MSKDEIKDRVEQVVAGVLGANPQPGVTAGNIAAWDSLKHMNVILAVENEFDVEFDDEDLANTHSIELLVEAVTKHLAS
jgi:acyl carrier protein